MASRATTAPEALTASSPDRTEGVPAGPVAAARAAIKQQRPGVVWFTGISGAGKSTIAALAERRLIAMGCHTYLIDGDDVRSRLCRDLGFSEVDRSENVRRVSAVASMMADAGLIVLAALISPFEHDRAAARMTVGAERFVVVHVDTPLALAEERDPKGLYWRARHDLIGSFTGITSPYERPKEPELHLPTASLAPDDAAAIVVKAIIERGWCGGRQTLAFNSSRP